MADSILTPEDFQAVAGAKPQAPPKPKAKPKPVPTTKKATAPVQAVKATAPPKPQPKATTKGQSILSDEDFAGFEPGVGAGSLPWGRVDMPVEYQRVSDGKPINRNKPNEIDGKAIIELYGGLRDHSPSEESSIGAQVAQEVQHREKAAKPAPPPKRPGRQGISRLPANTFGVAGSVRDPGVVRPWDWGINPHYKEEEGLPRKVGRVFARRGLAEEDKTLNLYDQYVASGEFHAPPVLSNNAEARKQQEQELQQIRGPVAEYLRRANIVYRQAGVRDPVALMGGRSRYETERSYAAPGQEPSLLKAKAREVGEAAVGAIGDAAHALNPVQGVRAFVRAVKGQPPEPSPALNRYLNSIRPEVIIENLGLNLTPLQRQHLNAVTDWHAFKALRSDIETLGYATDVAVNLIASKLGGLREARVVGGTGLKLRAGLEGAALAGGVQEGVYSALEKPGAPLSEHLKAGVVGAAGGAGTYLGLKLGVGAGGGLLRKGKELVSDVRGGKAEAVSDIRAEGEFRPGDVVELDGKHHRINEVLDDGTVRVRGRLEPLPVNALRLVKPGAGGPLAGTVNPSPSRASLLRGAAKPQPETPTPQAPPANPDASVLPTPERVQQAQAVQDVVSGVEPSVVPPAGNWYQRLRQWIAEGAETHTFPTETHRDVYVLGARLRGVQTKYDDILATTNKLRESLAERLGVDAAEVDSLAAAIYDDVRAQSREPQVAKSGRQGSPEAAEGVEPSVIPTEKALAEVQPPRVPTPEPVPTFKPDDEVVYWTADGKKRVYRVKSVDAEGVEVYGVAGRLRPDTLELADPAKGERAPALQPGTAEVPPAPIPESVSNVAPVEAAPGVAAPAMAPPSQAPEAPQRWVWRVPNGEGQAVFPSEAHRDAYVLGSRLRGATGDGIGNPNLGPTDKLREGLAKRLGVDVAEVDRLALQAYENTKQAMQGLKAGESRVLPDNLTPGRGADVSMPTYAASLPLDRTTTPELVAKTLVEASRQQAGSAGQGSTVNVPTEELTRAAQVLGLDAKGLQGVMRRHRLDGPGVVALADQIAGLHERARAAGQVWKANPTEENLLTAQLQLKELQAALLSLTGGQDAKKALSEFLALRKVARPGRQPATPPQAPIEAPGYGARNTLFPKEAADEAFERLAKKGTKLNSLADLTPETLDDFVQFGGYHLEAGLREFGDWAKVMTGTYGAEVEPHLGELWAHINKPGVLEEAARQRTGRKMLEALGGRKATEEQIAALAGMSLDPDRIAAWARKEARTPPGERLHSFYVGNVLSASASHLRNLLGNSAMLASSLPEKGLRAGWDVPLSAIAKRPREYHGAEFWAATNGVRAGFFEGGRRALSILRHGMSLEDAATLELPQGAEFGPAWAPWNASNRMLAASDAMFRSMLFQSELGALATRDGIRQGLKGEALQAHVAELLANPPGSLVDKATDYAKWTTFTSDPDKLVERVMQMRDAIKVPKEWAVVGGARPFGFLLPFVNVPANVVKASVTYSPAGFAQGVAQTLRQDPAAAETFARATIGSAMLAMFGTMALDGRITAGPPKDPTEARKWWASGKQPYSIRWGNKWVSYQNVGPVLEMLPPLVGLAEDYKKRGQAPDEKKVSQLAIEVGGMFRDLPVVSTVADWLDSLPGKEKAGYAPARALKGFVPAVGAVRSGNRIADPIEREQPRGFVEHFSEGLPFLDQRDPKLTPLGQPLKRENPVADALSPVRIRSVQRPPQDDVEEELAAIGYRPKSPRRKMVVEEEDVHLTPTQHRAWRQLRGNAVYRALRELFKSDEYRNASVEDKKWLVGEELRSVGEAERDAFLDLLDAGKVR